MTELPSDYRDYFVALAEGRIPWSNWPHWFALHARNLARLLGREQLARVKQDPQKTIPQFLSTQGIAYSPFVGQEEVMPDRTRGLAEDWALAVNLPSDAPLATMSRLRSALGLPLAAVPELRRQLPGVVHRGERAELERLCRAVTDTGFEAAVFPAYQLEEPPGDELSDPIGLQEYAVYSAICRTNLYRFDNPGTTFDDLVGEDPFVEHLAKQGAERFHGLFKYRCQKQPEMIEDFEKRNTIPTRLRKKFAVPGGYQLLSERRRLEPWREGSVFYLSRVGFNQDGTLALVGLSYFGGPLCGAGSYLLFRKSGVEWQLEDQCGVWVS